MELIVALLAGAAAFVVTTIVVATARRDAAAEASAAATRQRMAEVELELVQRRTLDAWFGRTQRSVARPGQPSWSPSEEPAPDGDPTTSETPPGGDDPSSGQSLDSRAPGPITVEVPVITPGMPRPSEWAPLPPSPSAPLPPSVSDAPRSGYPGPASTPPRRRGQTARRLGGWLGGKGVPLLAALVTSTGVLIGTWLTRPEPDCLAYSEHLVELRTAFGHSDPEKLFGDGALSFGPLTDACGDPTLIFPALEPSPTTSPIAD